jgi:hypothetical protein
MTTHNYALAGVPTRSMTPLHPLLYPTGILRNFYLPAFPPFISLPWRKGINKTYFSKP